MKSRKSKLFGGNAAHVVLFNDKRNKILLVKRSDFKTWVIPGGHLEKEESFRQAAKREAQEETGFNIKLEKKVAVYTNKKRNIKKEVYLGKVNGGQKKISRESMEIAWFPIHNLPIPMTWYEYNRIIQAINHRGKPIKKELKIDLIAELKWQLKKPKQFLILLLAWIKNR